MGAFMGGLGAEAKNRTVYVYTAAIASVGVCTPYRGSGHRNPHTLQHSALPGLFRTLRCVHQAPYRPKKDAKRPESDVAQQFEAKKAPTQLGEGNFSQ